MRASSVLQVIASLAIGTHAITEADYPWVAPGKGDSRAPCPGLNSLANHGILPHDGKNISLAMVKKAIEIGYGLRDEFAFVGFTPGLPASTTGNKHTLNLHDLANHNHIIEHDGSLSRADFATGDNYSFNKTVFAETQAGWTAPLINIRHAAKARKNRINEDKKENPKFSMSVEDKTVSYINNVNYVTTFDTTGDHLNPGANRSWVEFWFENERLPLSLGWKVPKFNSNTATRAILVAKLIAEELTN